MNVTCTSQIKALWLRERQRIQHLREGGTDSGIPLSFDIWPEISFAEDIVKPLHLTHETSEAL
jgi:hypothetical protein